MSNNDLYELWKTYSQYSLPLTGLNIKYAEVSMLNIDEQEKKIKQNAETYRKYLDQERLVDNLHPTTKHILRITSEIKTIEDYEKLDNYVRTQLFSKDMKEFLEGGE